MAEGGYLDQPDAIRKFALEVEGKRFWVPRASLALYSPVFKVMLYGSFDEAERDTVELPGKKAEDIEELLRCLLPNPCVKEVNDDNLELLLSLADEYQIEDIRSRADGFLRHQELPACEKGGEKLLYILRVAAKFLLKETLFLSIKRCASEFAFEDLKPLVKELPAKVSTGLLYAHESLVSRSCRYEYCAGSKLLCSTHAAPMALGFNQQTTNIYACIKCTFCGKRLCAPCITSGRLGDKSCKGSSDADIDTDIRGFLDSM